MNPSRELVPLHIADISLFSKSLRRLLAESGARDLPGHVVLLNLLAKSAGHRNYQALRVAPHARALRHRGAVAALAAAILGAAARPLGALGLLPAKRDLTEAEVNRYLMGYHAFGDPATLRRELVNARLLWRTPDCRVYRKEGRRPEAEVREFLATLFEHTANKGV